MGDKVTSEKTVGTHVVDGRAVNVVRSTWRDAEGLSYDLVDAKTGEDLTPDESFNTYPTDEQMAIAVEAAGGGSSK